MVLDGQFRLMSCNESVDRILQHDFEPYLGRPLADIRCAELGASAGLVGAADLARRR